MSDLGYFYMPGSNLSTTACQCSPFRLNICLGFILHLYTKLFLISTLQSTSWNIAAGLRECYDTRMEKDFRQRWRVREREQEAAWMKSGLEGREGTASEKQQASINQQRAFSRILWTKPSVWTAAKIYSIHTNIHTVRHIHSYIHSCLALWHIETHWP